MAEYQLHLGPTALRRVGMNHAKRVVSRATRQTYNRSAVLCPVDTGLLRASRQMTVIATAEGYLGVVEYHAEYAAAVHNGRRALTIRARPGGALRFKAGGRTVYARSVRQPARPGRPFLATALREVAAREGLRVISIG